MALYTTYNMYTMLVSGIISSNDKVDVVVVGQSDLTVILVLI